VVIAAPSAEPKVLPISLDTVLRLAEEQNPQLAVARERLNQAGLEQKVAESAWVPNLYVGSAYYRHEGGIQNEDGRLTHSSFGTLLDGMEVVGSFDLKEIAFKRVNAERQLWQQKGEVRRASNEMLLDAAGTYIDFLTARTGEVVLAELAQFDQRLLKYTEDVAKGEPGARVQLFAVQGTVLGHQQAVAKIHQQGDAAVAKLAYVLGLGPCHDLTPLDKGLRPFELVDASPPCCDLVARAVTNGPGVHELEGLLATIQAGMDEAKGPKSLLPIFEVRTLESAFGAGPGHRTTWDNRWDLGLAARWNVTEFLSGRDRLRIAESGLRQASLSLQDLRARLASGVQEAQQAILSGREQIALAEEQVKKARDAYELSWKRLQEHVMDSSAGEVLQAIRGIEAAQFNKLQIIRDYDKAQLRLLLLLDGSSSCAEPRL
jgi:outer membrane protein TolC